MDCSKCQFRNCKHNTNLYSIDIDHTVVVCNACGQVVYHGTKKACDDYIKNHNEKRLIQQDLEFWS